MRISDWSSDVCSSDLELRLEKVTAMLILAVLIAGFAVSDRMQRWAETAGYAEPVVYAESTPFQRIVLTRSGNDLRLLLNGRSAERRVGNECVITCRSWCSPYH